MTKPVQFQLSSGATVRLQVVAPHTFRFRMRQDDRFVEPALIRYNILRSDWPPVEFEAVHSAEAVTRYITAFKQVLLCQRRGLTEGEIAFAVKMSRNLVKEYLRLIRHLARKNPALEKMLEENLERLLRERKEARMK